MKKFTLLTIVAIIAMAFIGCETVPENNSNTAVVVNDNTDVNRVNTNANTETAKADDDWDWDMTREDYDKDKDKYEKKAKEDYKDDSWGTGANDSWLWFKTRASLSTVDDLRDSTINVDVSNEVVTLKGTVATEAGMKAAEAEAKKVEGVKSVKNELKVDKGDSMTNQMTSDNSKEDMKEKANANK